MRCTSCLSYIPEGLPSPVKCPQCGVIAQAPKSGPEKSGTSATEPQDTRAASAAFAPYFTITTKLAFGVRGTRPEPKPGSISFGPSGFSVVWDDGKHWNKFYYRELGPARIIDDSIALNVKDVESRLTLYHSWLPRWASGARRTRAQVFLELLSTVKDGLTPEQIEFFQKKLA